MRTLYNMTLETIWSLKQFRLLIICMIGCWWRDNHTEIERLDKPKKLQKSFMKLSHLGTDFMKLL